MPLSDTTKNTIASLATILSQDVTLCIALRSAADRLLPADQSALIRANLCARDANGTAIPSAQAALSTLAADVGSY